MHAHCTSTFSCPKCGHFNSITTAHLPLGTPLHCSQCSEHLGNWHGSEHGFRNAETFRLGPADNTDDAMELAG